MGARKATKSRQTRLSRPPRLPEVARLFLNRPEGTLNTIGTIRVTINRTNYLLNILLHSFESITL